MNLRSRIVAGMSAGVLVCVAGLQSSLGDGFRNPPDGASSLGRAGARLTRGEDPSVIAHNPANLMDLEGTVVTPAATIAYSEVEYTSPAGVSEKTEDPWRVLPSVFAARRSGDGRYACGIGLNFPYGQLTEWKSDGLFRVTAPYKAEMTTWNTTPAAAMQVTDALSIGVGVNLAYSELEFNQNLPWLPLPAGLTGPASPMTFDGDGWGVGAKVGCTWSINDRQRVAVAYQSPIDVDYEGDFTIENAPPGLPAARSDFETEIRFPSIVAVGYDLQATERLRLEANVEWIEHSRNDAIGLDIGVNNPVLVSALGSTAVPQEWDDTVAVDIGGDYRLHDRCVLRAGWTWLPTPVPERTLSTTQPESDRHMVGVGIGLGSDDNMLDLAFNYGIAEDVTVTDNVNPAVNGTYEFTSTLLAVSYSRTF